MNKPLVRATSSAGLELKLERIAAAISQRELAHRMGVLPQRVSAIEGSYRPTSRTVARYRLALAAAIAERGGRP